MKRMLVLVLLGLLAMALNAKSGFARPDYKKQFDASYKNSKVAKAAEEAKCHVCHAGKSKKDRNDYGKALAKLLNPKTYEQLKDNKDKLNEIVLQALKAVAKEKSASGKTFGELIEAGTLPGTATAAAK